MKKIITIFFLLTTFIFAQNYKLTKDAKSGKTMLIGITNKEALQDSNFSKWYNYQYKNYKIDTSITLSIKEKLKDKNIKIVLGTWCSDSRREVPRMLKILDTIGFRQDSLTLIFVDRTKSGLNNETNGLNIERVPTFIIYKNEKEIGRIIETPEETLEKDLLKIVSKL